MQKLFFLLIFIITFVIAQTEITFSKTFIKKIKPDTLSTSINITSQKLSQEQTIERLTKISDFVDASKHLDIKGGTYSVNPHMVYDNGKSYQDGYDGSISYTVLSKNPQELNKFIRDIQRLGDKEKLMVSISSVSWQISEEQQAKQGDSDSLRLDAILWAKQYAKSLSLKIGKSCKVSRIDFHSNQSVFSENRKVLTISSDSAPIPAQDEQTMQIIPSFTLVCR
ncbi:MAG: SIMPL domain-containing protein [Sulfurovaceae bacterium]|nr:SIMPL domain-containing protein [Sulfurovaceae bacterium]